MPPDVPAEAVASPTPGGGLFADLIAALRNALIDPSVLFPILQAVILLVVGYAVARVARFAVVKGLKSLNVQQRMLAQRGAFWGVLTLFAVSAMRELGFEFGVFLGAAGIVTIALGFASQTSASNLISGLFLVLERAIEVGDVIRVDGFTGEVLSIDLLSTQLRTFDNLLVRIPNETMVKAQITNLNRLPIRRVDLHVGVGYGSDIDEALRCLQEAARHEPLILEEPAPIVIAQGFGASSIDYQFSVWTRTDHFLEVRNALQRAVKQHFDEGGIEIPFPQRTLHAHPLDIRLVDGSSSIANDDASDATPTSAGAPRSSRPGDAGA